MKEKVLGYEGVVLHKFFDRLFPADRVYAAGLTRKFSKLAKEEGYEVNLVQSVSKSGYINNYVVIHPAHLKKLLDNYNFKKHKILDLQGYDTMEHFKYNLEELIKYEYKLLNDSTIRLVEEDRNYEGEPMPIHEEKKIFRTAIFFMFLFGVLLFNACKVFGASQMVVEQYIQNRRNAYGYLVQHAQILQFQPKTSKNINRLESLKSRAQKVLKSPDYKEALILSDSEVKELNSKMMKLMISEPKEIQNTIRGNY